MLRLRASVALLSLLLLSSIACGRDAAVVAPGRAASAAAAQDLLEAQAAGLVEVRFIPNDSQSAQVVVRSRSDRPLTLRLPEGFAGVPVLAQFMNQQQGGAGFGAGGIGGTPQNVGGGGGGMGGMGGGMGGGVGGGPFSLPPERTRTLRVPTVCLEYGKREPSPRIEYRMTPLAECSTDPRLQDVLTALADGKLSQKAAQAAAWHVASGRTWDQLAAEVIQMAGGDPDRPYFAVGDLVAARAFVTASAERHPAEPVASESTGR
ncbi:MAG: hypothetical protein ACKOC8_01215 [Pirellulales bacterium]